MMWREFLVVIAVCLFTVDAIQCVDEDGNDVDWWFIYKMPNGFNYAYKDSNDHKSSITPFDDRTLDRLDGALGSTLHQIYANKKKLGYALYNDEKPDAKTLWQKGLDMLDKHIMLKEGKGGAHAKGVVATNGETGFWLIHSVPKFPDLGPKDFTWTADDTYGQSFLCISLDTENIETVATQLQHFHPSFFETNMPADVAKYTPTLAALISGDRITGPNVEIIKSLEGMTFHSFAKDHDWNDDLDVLVAPTLKVGFNWETWRRGGDLPSTCGTGKTTFDAINVVAMNVGGTYFKYTQDHAKIGVATSGNTSGGYVCVGGINRMESQRKRGGGTVCFKTIPLWKALSSSVAEVEDCA